MRLKRRKRVRVHLKDDKLPTLEGLLVAKRLAEYALAVPSVQFAAGAKPLRLDEARLLLVPRENVAFYEELH